jgi:Uma2 family endonuclease
MGAFQMNAVLKTSSWISPEEYLDGERFSEVRHEYIDGYVYAMAGASDDHNRIALNIAAELKSQLRGGPCEAFMNDMKQSFARFFALLLSGRFRRLRSAR